MKLVLLICVTLTVFANKSFAAEASSVPVEISGGTSMSVCFDGMLGCKVIEHENITKAAEREAALQAQLQTSSNQDQEQK